VTLTFRPPAPAEMPEFYRVGEYAFSDAWDPEELEAESGLLARERLVTAEEDGRLVCQGGAFEFQMAVPGGSARCSGITWIGVLPTHRRRGILTGMMSYLHQMAHEAGEPVAALWAAESAIYPRFGYGMAAADVDLEIERDKARWAATRETTGRVRLIDAKDAAAAYGPVYEHELARRPGMMPRDERWWAVRLLDTKERRDGASNLFHAVHEGPAGIDGYVAYRVKYQQGKADPGSVVKVLELVANTEDAYRAVWNFCFNIDLSVKIQARHRPADEPLAWMLADFRQLQVRQTDGLWVRLVDVDAALSARRYAVEGSLVIEVVDDGCPWNAGRHHLEGAMYGAHCSATNAEPDLRLDVRDLGATYLGGVDFTLLAAAGRVEECTPGALSRADAMFRWRPAPWCPAVF
jgi:predicted acetyltransferase